MAVDGLTMSLIHLFTSAFFFWLCGVAATQHALLENIILL